MTSSYIGKVVDNYRILSQVGIGGMGVVFKAIHIGLDKIVALKMIAPGMAMNANFIRRFQTEAKALARLADPNIVQIYDLRSADDQWFIVMEYVDGGNLGDIIRKEGALSVDRSVSVTRQMLSAIGHAHSAGIIHRDIKPNNVMLTAENIVKITDFGLAKDQGNIANTVTVAGGGTLYYMSPEHVKGFSFTDRRSDIYSIGMTFYEMISGNVPFHNVDSDFDIREMIVRKSIIPPKTFKADIPHRLEEIIMKALAKKPEDRYQTCNEMIADLDEFEGVLPATGQKTSTRTTKQIARPVAEKRLKNKYLWWAAAGLIILISAFLFFWMGSQNSGQQKEPANEFALLTIRTLPSGAIVLVDDDTVSFDDRTDYQITAGQHRLRALSDGFNAVDTLIQVRMGNHRSIALKLKQSSVSEVQSGYKKDEDKIAASVPEIKKEAEKPKETIVTKTKISSAVPEKEPDESAIIKTGLLEILTQPPEAQVTIDGEKPGNGITPVIAENIPEGAHKIVISKAGYSSVNEDIVVKAGTVNKYAYTLNAQTGKLIVNIRPWGSIYLNNELKKASTDFKYEIELPAKTHLLKVAHPTLGVWEKQIKIESESDLNITVNFNKSQPVNIVAVDTDGNPVQAEILLDNKPTGEKTPNNIKLRTGVHRISVAKEGYIALDSEKIILIDEAAANQQKFIMQRIE
ncbi:MAG: serine/threonine protein kinase [Calditrichaceae bacterium]|nr:serine/threonine protein kinase [Calditrichaceae bacterium]MBN2710727.1 serine/threonine protein kinase [Calditrichaceae bacterium]RQV92756.1 MAG: serine/threonine protein kinase [Calditrichota bacterium]